MQASSKGYGHSVRMRRLVWVFAGRTYQIVGNIMLRLEEYFNEQKKKYINLKNVI